MNKFLIITDKDHNKRSATLLFEAARKLGKDPIEIDGSVFNAAELDSIATDDQDALYRVGINSSSKEIYAYFTSRPAEQRPRVERIDLAVKRVDGWEEVRALLEAGVPAIPTEFISSEWMSYPDDKLQQVVDSLGGFPVVMKREGLSRGAGVSLVEDMDDLRSRLASIDELGYEEYALREFLDDCTHARVAVVGGSVVDAIKYIQPDDDFRTNAGSGGEIRVVPGSFSTEIYAVCEHAAATLNTTIGGIDVLIDNRSGKFYIAELNCPFNFARNEDTSGVKVSEKIVDSLLG